jgi:hypothetical protein
MSWLKRVCDCLAALRKALDEHVAAEAVPCVKMNP